MLPFNKLWSRLPDFYEKYKFLSPRASKYFHVFLRWHTHRRNRSLSAVSKVRPFCVASSLLATSIPSVLLPRARARRDLRPSFFALAVTSEFFSPSVKRSHSHRVVAVENLRDDPFDLFQSERSGWRPAFFTFFFFLPSRQLWTIHVASLRATTTTAVH